MLAAISANAGEELDQSVHDDTVLAALLHDVGHGPFSHSFEDILRGIDVPFDHERLGVRLLTESEGGFFSTLERGSPGRAGRIVKFIDKEKREQSNWTYALVSSQLDADRLDYVRRDAAAAGVTNHQPDIARLIDNLSLADGRIVVDERAVDVVESFLLALDHMYERVYFHKAVRGAAVLVSAVIRCAAKANDDVLEDVPLRDLLQEGDRVALSKYARVSDATLWHYFDRWQDAGDRTLSYLASRLRRRELPKAFDLRGSASQSTKLHQKAVELARDAIPGVDPDIVVCFDDLSRVNLKRRFVLSEGEADSILIRPVHGQVHAIEERQRTIAKEIANKMYVDRLFVPQEIRSDLQRFADHEKIAL